MTSLEHLYMHRFSSMAHDFRRFTRDSILTRQNAVRTKRKELHDVSISAAITE